MPEVRAARTLPWSADIVWPYLIALEHVPHWEDDVLDVRLTTAGPPAVGSRLSARRVYAGREATLEGTIVALDPGRSATIELRGGPLVLASATYSIDPTGPSTSLVTYTGSVQLRGLARLVTPLVPLMGRRQVETNLRRLERRIANGIGPTEDVPTPD
jgi:hypothetical protein